MPPPFLFLNASRAGGAQVFRYDGATPTQIGNTFGTLETDTSNYMGKNRVIQFQNDLYACQNLGVYKLQGDGVTWSNASMDGGLPFTSPLVAGEEYNRTGLYPITISGESYLIGAFINSSNELIVFTMDAATNTWSETSALVTIDPASPQQGGFTFEIVFQNKLFLGIRANGGSYQTYSYDPVLNNLSILTNPFPAFATNMVNSPCIHNGRLFVAYITGSGVSGRFNLAEFTGTQWVNIGQVTSGSDSANTFDLEETRLSLMSDGTNLYYIYPFSNTNSGFRIVEITDVDSLPGTNIQGTVFPIAILSSGDGGTGFPDLDPRLTHVIDTQTNPGSPDHYFYFSVSATAGTSMQLYKWNGNSALITAEGVSGGDVLHAIPTASAAGGERIFSDVSTDNDILITDRETVSGGIQVTFRAYSPSGTASGSVRIWISTEGEPVMTQATLSSPVTGGSATLNGNVIQTVVADGATDYTVVIPSGANSFSNLDQVDLVPEFA